MKQMIANRMSQLTPSGIRKVNEKALAMERAGERVLHFEIGRPDFDTPDYIKKACEASIERGEVFYTSNYGTAELRQAIAEKLERQNHVPCRADEILVTVGLSEAVYDLLTSILDEGDEILIPDPVWMNYLNVPKLLGAVPVEYSLREENGYQLDLEEIRAKITPRTKAVVIVTPNNPTGSVLSQAALQGLRDIAVERDIMVIADEIYERLIYDGAAHVSIASLPGMKERTVTLNGFSKAYSMTGWRIGYAAAPRELIDTMNKLHQHNTTCAPSFVQRAAVAALRQEGGEVEEMVREYQRRRDYFVEAVNAIEGLSCVCPKGAFYVFVNCKALGRPSAEIAGHLLARQRVACVPGDVFGKGGEGYLRFSFAAAYEEIVEGCALLAQGIEELRW